ncbi:MAG: hypothetical protein AMXMBFR83_23130 [Phycisphaerae bacterium]
MRTIGLAAVVAGMAGAAFGQEKPAAVPASEELVRVLESDAPQKDKATACRLLQRVGDKAAIPALARLLTDEKLAHMARYALEPIPEPAVDEALRGALGKVNGRLLIGVVTSLGVRRDAQSVEAMARLLTHEDAGVVQAAARALGSIGKASSAKALMAALPRTAATNRLDFCEGLLRCAEGLAAAGSREEAVAIYDALRGMKDGPHQVRAAGVRGAILARRELGLVLLKEYLQDKDFGLFAAACRTSQEMPGPDVTKALTAALGSLPAENQVLLIQTIGFRAEAAAVPALTMTAREGAKAVRLAAVRALAEIRHESALAALRELAKDTDEDLAKAATEGVNSFQPAQPPPRT